MSVNNIVTIDVSFIYQRLEDIQKLLRKNQEHRKRIYYERRYDKRNNDTKYFDVVKNLSNNFKILINEKRVLEQILEQIKENARNNQSV